MGQRTRPSGNPQARRILVVDDEVDTAESFARLLQAMGHEAQFITDPLDALSAARALRPELVFLDIGMPLITGYELARLFRKAYGLDSIRLVALTAYKSEDHRAQSRQAGFDAHVTKPV